MISLIEALNYRCLRYIRQPLEPFHVLVGPNASGKTTFLDVVALLSRLVSDGLDAALEERTADFDDLLWRRSGERFELALEATIPPEERNLLANTEYDHVRYAVVFAKDGESGEVTIAAENGWLVRKSNKEKQQLRLSFPKPEPPPPSISEPRAKQKRKLFSKSAGGNDNYYADAHEQHGRWAPAFKLGPRKSTLGNLPEDESNFPVSTWFKHLLTTGVERFVLNSQEMRLASPPGRGSGFRPDGSNLPWVVHELQTRAPERIGEWIRHLQTALPDLEGVKTVLRQDDRHRYLVLVYRGGLEVPSWMASDGTLRLMALTLPAYLDNLRGIFLIEEPENGIHPLAVETMYQSLSSVYRAQILLATHSPVILSTAHPEDVLCFAKDDEGATDTVAGHLHPKLRDWRGQQNLGTLFAAGVLG